MHTVEFTLVLLACVIASAVLAQVVRQLSLPLVQIVAGVVVACIVPTVYGVDIPAELFLVLFIAPLLFDEARSINRRALWENKGAIVSLAVGLVLLTVLVVGFVLHWFVPSIPLAAAFACAAALAPTDAAAVGALGSRVGLKPRQSTLLAGESLINDASGVVAFQFAIAAALTGTFSAAVSRWIATSWPWWTAPSRPPMPRCPSRGSSSAALRWARCWACSCRAPCRRPSPITSRCRFCWAWWRWPRFWWWSAAFSGCW